MSAFNPPGPPARLTFASAAALALAAPALAQTPATPPEAQDGSAIARILVTAERRSVDSQDLAIAATVRSGEDLVEQGVNALGDIQRIAPSLAINTFNRSTFVNIRGVGIAQSAPTSSPGVAYYLDGALIPHEQFIGQSFFDIGAIEVLRGPQGTLTGQNSTGGAIYVRTPAPEFGEYSGHIDQTFGEFGHSKTQVAANIPLGSFAAMRAAIINESRDSFTANIGPSGSQPGNIDLLAGRVNLEVRPSEKLTFNLRYEQFEFNTDNNAVKRRNDTVSQNPFIIQEDARSFLIQQGYRASAEGQFDITDAMRLRYIYSKQLGTTKDQTDGDRTATALPRPLPPAANNANTGRVSYARTEFDTATHELNLLSTRPGPFEWVVGAFYLEEEVPVMLLRDNTNTRDFVQSAVRGSTIITEAVNTSKSAFGQLSWDITPWVELVGGARFSEDQQDYSRLASPGGVGETSQQSDATTGRLAVNLRPLDDILLYLSASRGYKAGGVNLTLSDPNFQPEVNDVVELGAKTQVLDGRVQLNGAVFSSDYQDIQLASLRSGLPTTQNAASGEAVGAEIEFQALIEGGLSVNAGLGWLDATFAQNTCLNDTNAPPGTDAGCSTGNRLVPAGRVLPFSPEWTFNAGIDYEIALANGLRVTPRIQISYMSDQYATPFLSALTLVPRRTILDYRITVRPFDNLSVEAFLSNALDETYIASQIQNSSSADGGMIFGAPRRMGVRARVDF